MAKGLPQIPMEATGRPLSVPADDMPLPRAERPGWAVMGLGHFALSQVLPAFGGSKASRLAGLVSGDRDKARLVAHHYDVGEDHLYGYDDFDRISDDDDIDIIYNVMPNGLHAEWTIRALEAGKHVICEKPMANTVEECREMIAAARKADRRLMIAYRAHFEPNNIRALELKHEGAFGDLKMVNAVAMRPIDVSRPRDEWRVRRALAGGGSMMDIGIYALNGALYYLEESPIELSAQISTPVGDPRFAEVEDTMTVELRFASGAVATIGTSYSMYDNRIGLVGTKGRAMLFPATGYAGNELVEGGKEMGLREVPVGESSTIQFAAELDHFSRCVMEGREPRTGGEMGLRDVALIHAMYAAAEAGTWVRLNQDGTLA
jgi:glucose-fructose oxidoreductase